MSSLKLRNPSFGRTTSCLLKLTYPWTASKLELHEFPWACESLENLVKIQVIFQEL